MSGEVTTNPIQQEPKSSTLDSQLSNDPSLKSSAQENSSGTTGSIKVSKSQNFDGIEVDPGSRLQSKSARANAALEECGFDSVISDSIPSKMVGENGSTESSEEDPPYVVPNMWELENIGLYSQYAAVGLLYGSATTLMQFCVYVKGGEANVCSNSYNIVFFAWNFKIVFAVITDMYRPFGLRKKPWMLFGWLSTLIILLLLACIPESSIDLSTWLTLLLLTQFFMMFSDVPSDGYSVELGKMEPNARRGQILATGQRIRFIFAAFSGLIQMFLLNGPTTNAPDSPDAWSWGLTMQGYYGLLFAITFVLVIPIFFFKEVQKIHKVTGVVAATPPAHTFAHFREEIWIVLQNQTTLYLLIYVTMFQSFGSITNQANVYLQYYVIQLSGFQTGIDSVTSMLALVLAIYIFQTYLIKRNWRFTQWASASLSILAGLMWIPAYYNDGGTRNAYYTIFIDLDRSFISGVSQVLYSLSVIELAKQGIEATTYELVITVGNACLTLNGILGTQLLFAADSTACEESYASCPNDSVAVTSGAKGFEETDGPNRYTRYNLIVSAISLVNACIWVWWLPSSVEECAEWKEKGEMNGLSKRRGLINVVVCVTVVLYGFVVAFLLLNTSTSCLEVVGGLGC